MRGRRSIIAAILFTLAAVYAVGYAPAGAPRFKVTDMVIRDAVTGLAWSRDGNPAGQLLSWDHAGEYIRMLNKERYAGYDDWRLPHINELKKLVKTARETRDVKAFAGGVTAASVLTDAGFRNMQEGNYWSSTENNSNIAEVWSLSMQSGVGSVVNKSLYLYVLPVR